MQVNMDAFRQGAGMYDASLSRQRQDRLDAQAEERHEWDRAKVERERAAYDEAQRIGNDTQALLARAPELDDPYGAPPGAASAPANPTEANAVQSPHANPAENNLAAGLQSGLRHLAAQRQLALNAVRMAQASGDQQAFLRAAQAVQEIDAKGQRARVVEHTLNNPEAQASILGSLNNNPAMGLKAKRAENGFTQLVAADGAEVAKLSPMQLAMAAGHMFDIKALGRVEEGYKGLQSISKELADAVAAANSFTEKLASSANEGEKFGLEAALKSAQTTQAYAAADNASANANFTNTARTRAAEAAAEEKRRLTEERENPWRREVREYAARLNADVKDGTMTREQAEASIAQFASEKHADAIITKVMPRLRQAQRDGQLDAALEQLGSVGGAPPELVERARRRMGVAPQGGASAGSGARAPASRMAPPKTGTAAQGLPTGRVSSVLPPEMITRNDDLRVMSDMRRMAALGDAQWERELAQERALQERARMEQDMQQRFNNVNLYRR